MERSDKNRKRTRRTTKEIKERLLNAASAEFTEKNFANATTSSIAKRAGIAEIQIYRLFPTKEDMFLESTITPLSDEFRSFVRGVEEERCVRGGMDKKVSHYLHELQGFLKEHARALITANTTQTYGDASSHSAIDELGKLQTLICRVAELIIEPDGGHADCVPSVNAKIALGTLLGCLTYREWLFPEVKEQSRSLEDAIHDFVRHGLELHSDIGPKNRSRA